MLNLQPITLKEANNFVAMYHRHHKPVIGDLFAIGVNDGNEVIGVCIVGRPVARGNQDGYTAEVTRLCTNGFKNACSILYAAAWRACRAMGYHRLITYILESENGISLKAAGFKELYKTKGGSWNCESRPRFDKHPLQPKTLFEVSNFEKEVKG